MQCLVYILRRKGEKLAGDEVRGHPASGWLYLGPDIRKHYPAGVARLFRSDSDRTDILEPMTYPTVRSIVRGGVLIVGSEEVRNSVLDRQTWFCVPDSPESADLTVGMETRPPGLSRQGI